MSSQNKACRCGTLQFLSPVSTVSAKKAWDHDSFLACTHKRKEQKKKRLHFYSLAAKQEKLVSVAACLNQNLFAYDRMSTSTCFEARKLENGLLMTCLTIKSFYSFKLLQELFYFHWQTVKLVWSFLTWARNDVAFNCIWRSTWRCYDFTQVQSRQGHIIIRQKAGRSRRESL